MWLIEHNVGDATGCILGTAYARIQRANLKQRCPNSRFGNAMTEDSHFGWIWIMYTRASERLIDCGFCNRYTGGLILSFKTNAPPHAAFIYGHLTWPINAPTWDSLVLKSRLPYIDNYSRS